MNKLPTAKQFCENLDKEIGEYWSNDYDELPNQMIEFAKLHVEEALKEVVKNARFKITSHKIQVIEDSIKNAYPLENIK